jgi:hypothetical protein
MDRRINWQLQFREHVTKFPRRFLILGADVEQMKFGSEAVADPFRFSKNVLEPGRKGCRYRNGFVRRWIAHRS